MSDRLPPLIAGNWKMHKGAREAEVFSRSLLNRLTGVVGREVVVFPPFTSIPAVAGVLRGSAIRWGAQDVFWEKEGAFTGEVSPPFLVELGCRYVLVGHSERRRVLGETDQMCGLKMKAALECGLRPVLCCGETLEERERGATFEVISRQLALGLAGISGAPGFDIAYEPVWAIGTGKNATPEQVCEVHSYIRRWLKDRFETADTPVRIIYGGSVKPDNIDSLMKKPDVDGVLVGGASLELDSFARIVEYRCEKDK